MTAKGGGLALLLLALAACEKPTNKQTDKDRDRCQQYDGSSAAVAVDTCTRLLQADDARLVRHVHAYSWRAQAFTELQQWDRAKADFRKVLELEPSYALATREIRRIEELREYELRTGSRPSPN